MRINERVVARLNSRVGDIFRSVLREKYGMYSDVKVDDSGLSFRFMHKWHDLRFFLKNGPQIWVMLDTETRGGENLKDLVEKGLKERASENEVEKSKYLSRRKVVLNGGYILIEARLKRVPEPGEEKALEEEVRTYITKPALAVLLDYSK